jgi:hypothetical protein
MRKLLPLAFVIFSTLAWGQGSYVSFPLQTPTGYAIAGASVALCTSQPTTVTPCGGSTLQQTYSSITLATRCILNQAIQGPTYGPGCTNPGLSDGSGLVRLYAPASAGSPAGYLYYQAYGQGIIVPDVEAILFPGSASGTGNVNGPVSSSLNNVSAFNNTAGTLLQDTGIPYTNLVTQTTNGAANQVCTYSGTNKICIPGSITTGMLPTLFQTNTVNNSTPTSLNMKPSTTDAVGLHLTPINPTGNQETFEITGGSYSGTAANATNATTAASATVATALAATPSQCSGSQFATGITAAGAANCATPSGTISGLSQGLTVESLTPTTIITTPATIYVKGNYSCSNNSAGAPEVGACIRAATCANLGAHIYVDYQGDQALGSHPICSTQLGDGNNFVGTIEFLGGVYHQYAPDSTIVVPGHVILKGLGQGTTAPTSVNSPGATIFQACKVGDTHAYCNGTGGSPSTGFTASTETSAITSGAVATGTATITWTGTSAFYQGQNITISSASVSQCNGTFQLITATTFSVGSSGCTAWTGGTATGPPTQLAFGRAASGISSAVEFESSLQGGLQFDANGVPNVISIANGYCQENCGVTSGSVLVTNYAAGSSSSSATGGGGIGLSLFNGSGTGSTNSRWIGLNLGNSITTCVPNAVAIQALSSGPKVISGGSIVNTNCSTFPNYDVVQGGSGAFDFHFENFHLESFAIAAIFVAGTNQGTSGVHINDVNACCNGSLSGSAVVAINNGNFIHNATLENINSTSPGAPPNVIIDQQNSVTIARSAHQIVGKYMLGDSGQVLYDSTSTGLACQVAGTTCNIFTGTVTLPSGSPLANGSQTAWTPVTVTAANPSSPHFGKVSCGFNGDPSGVTGYAPGATLTVVPYLTSGQINGWTYNNTGSSVTPGAMTLNCTVTQQ